MMPTHYYVISHDAGEGLPFGVAWFDEIGNPSANPWRYFATRDECVAHVSRHKYWTNPVCLCDETAEAA